MDLEWDNFHTELESIEGHPDWLDSKVEETDIGGTAAAVITSIEVVTVLCVKLVKTWSVRGP